MKAELLGSQTRRGGHPRKKPYQPSEKRDTPVSPLSGLSNSPSALPSRRSAEGVARVPRRYRRPGAGEVPLPAHPWAPPPAHDEPSAAWGLPRCRVPRVGRGLPAVLGPRCGGRAAAGARGGRAPRLFASTRKHQQRAGGRIGGGGSGGGSETGRPSGPRSRYRAQQRPPSHAVPGLRAARPAGSRCPGATGRARRGGPGLRHHC